jgi:ABC-2 type transport system permease protein
MFTLAARELRGIFLSPLAWSILGVVQFILAYIFLAGVDTFLRVQAQLPNIPNAPGFTEIVGNALFGTAGIVFLLVSPLLTMRLISDERRNNTLPLLLSAPLPRYSIILGKYLGLMGFFSLMIALTTLMPLSLLLGGVLDFGLLAAQVLGLLLLVGAFCAVGLYMSSLTAHPTVAAIASFGALLLLWIIDWAGGTPGESGLFAYLSMTNHFESLLKGLFKTQDVIYYLLFIVLFLSLSARRLEGERLA